MWRMMIGVADEYVVTLEGVDGIPAPSATGVAPASVVAELPWSGIGWGRVELDISAARVTVPRSFFRPSPSRTLTLQAWDQFIGIYRNGKRVWRGPLVGWRTIGNQVELGGLDILAFARKRFLYSDRIFTNEDVWAIISQLVQDVETGEGETRLWVNMDPAQVHVGGVFGYTTSRSYLTTQFIRLYEAIASLAKEEGVFYAAGPEKVHYQADEFRFGSAAPALSERTAVLPGIAVDALEVAEAVYAVDADQGYGGAGVVARVIPLSYTPYSSVLLEEQASGDGRAGSSPVVQGAVLAAQSLTPNLTLEAIELLPAFGSTDPSFDINSLMPGLVVRWAFEDEGLTSLPVVSGRPTNIEAFGSDWIFYGYDSTDTVERVKLVRLDVSVEKTDSGLKETLSASFIPWAGGA